jgi:hypothetical protein
MKISSFVKVALALALIGGAVIGTVATQKDERIVVALWGDPTQW